MHGLIGITGVAHLASSLLALGGADPLRTLTWQRQSGVQVAQLTYKGYMSCQNARGSCEIELNRKKSQIKKLCRSIWSGYWPERAELDPSTIIMYTNWCNTAKSDVRYALSEYPNLIGFISRYKEFDPTSATDEEVIIAAKNSAVFTSRCKSGNAERAANAADLWGSNKYDSPGLTEMYAMVPLRYSEILSACGDSSSKRSKAWIHKFNDNLRPVLAEIWEKRARTILEANGRSCKIDRDLRNLSITQQELELEKLSLIGEELALSSDALDTLRNMENETGAPLNDGQSGAETQLAIQIRDCDQSIRAVSSAIEESKAEEQRKALEKASREERIRLEKEYARQRAEAAAKAQRMAQPTPSYRPTPQPPKGRQAQPAAPTLPVWFEKKGGG